MVSLEDAVIARLESGGHRFEILIDPNEAQAFKDGGKNLIRWAFTSQRSGPKMICVTVLWI